MRILIIEDNAIQALSLQMIVKRFGFSEVEKVFSAQEAMEYIEEFKPDLMLVDINLGSKISGIDIVKKAQKKRKVQVMYISGNSDSHHKKIADETNHIGYLIKPIDPIKLEKVLKENQILVS